jgi:signal transduction histidine kinase/HAMP domain-containing protein/ActR/RegA family two-component response regulator
MRVSISTKLLAITVGVVSLAVALAGGALLRQHHRALEGGFEDGTVVLARAVAEHCVGPVAFEDRKGAMEILAKLERSTVVGRAILYDRHNRVMASYDRLGNAAPILTLDANAAVRHLDGYLHVFEPVAHDDNRLGTLYLTASSAGLRGRAYSATLKVLFVGLAAIAVAAVLAWALQRTVTRPILRLAETMRSVTGETMHLARVEPRRTDEIGVLHAGFNRMIDQLAARQVERDRSDARLRALIAALPDPVFVLDQGGRIVEVLAGRPGPLPLPAAGLQGKPITEVITPENARPIDDGIAQAVATMTPQRLAYELDLPSGKRCFDAVIVPISGEPTPHEPGRYVLFVPRDITERQTLELDLRQAQKMDALGRLAGGVAHDFNNLLTAIMGYASLLMGIQESEGRSTAEVDEILKAGKRASLLTQQLLAFSRRHRVQVRPVGLNELVRDMQRMLERIIGEDVQLVAELAPALSPVQGDPGQMQQVILNLAVNAREAMPNGGTLTLRTRAVSLTSRRAGDPELKPGPYVLLEVTDTGVGMDESTRVRIFEPFFTTKGRTGGTGLGLAMVYGIVRQSGGDVSVLSERQRGTTFRIYLPEASASAETAALTPPAGEALPRGSETVLVVEDEEPLKELTCRMLRDQGYQVLSTTEARQALEICGAYPGPIHLLVTDMVMPRMGGAELAEAARTLRTEMRVLYMSGYTDSASLNGSVETFPFLQKPFTAQELGRRVREALAVMEQNGAGLRDLRRAH